MSLKDMLDELPATVTASDEIKVFAAWLRSDEAREVVRKDAEESYDCDCKSCRQEMAVDILAALAAHVEQGR